MNLEEAFRLTIDIVPPVEIGDTPLGRRSLIGASGGTIVGERLNGTLNPGGGDWMLSTADGYSRPDVRHTLTTHDGAVVYFHGGGLIEMNEATLAAIGGQRPSDFGDAYIRLSLTLESGDSRYAWVNESLFVAEGRLLAGPRIEYVVHRLA
ncbi:DUF3237 family protein [Kineococcus aurantiacus]|uniref:UPF0311 protein BJ968_000035 n=1 Tax=Kineococcus aurantiacus TaxID=37633 RepID=A0A7Y9AR72_9ACTN|nr:hypothetical protein [Kineococcus aurantiacus]